MDIKAHIKNLERQIEAGNRMIAEYDGEDKLRVESMVKTLKESIIYWSKAGA